MTNPDQDVTLGEMAKEVTEWMCGDVEGLDKVEGLKRSLDVIREVEEAIDELGEMGNYIHELYQLNECNRTSPHYESVIILADPETRLRAIYSTLQESGEI